MLTYKDKLTNLKARIKEKYKTIRQFCYSTGMDVTTMNNLFSERLSPLKADGVWKEVEDKIKLMPKLQNDAEITDEERNYIRGVIYKNYRNVAAFLVDNPTYTKSFMSNVLGGRRLRKDLRYDSLMRTINLLEKTDEKLTQINENESVETDNWQSL